MSRHVLLAIAVGCVSLGATITTTTAVVYHNETVRMESCVEAGGSYVLTANGSGRECQR